MDPVTSVLSSFFLSIVQFLPQFFAGILILVIGMVFAELLKQTLIGFFDFLKLEKLMSETKLVTKHDVKVWPKLIAEFMKLVVFVAFLVAAVEVWGIGKVGDLLNQLLLYLPNVFVAVVMVVVGIIVANLASDLVEHSTKSMMLTSARTLAVLTRYVILVFTALLALHQLGVAQDLIRILFTGIVAMLALAGGLAFGLGGQETARDILKSLQERLKEKAVQE